jgi:hypothetical protein
MGSRDMLRDCSNEGGGPIFSSSRARFLSFTSARIDLKLLIIVIDGNLASRIRLMFGCILSLSYLIVRLVPWNDIFRGDPLEFRNVYPNVIFPPDRHLLEAAGMRLRKTCSMDVISRIGRSYQT